MINMNYLYAFFVCAEQMNFSKAARILGISQPSLSLQIKNLEEQLGTQLFLRNGKSVSLTSKGKNLLKSADRFFDLKDEVLKVMENQSDLDQVPSTRILVTDEIERPFVAEVVAKVAKRLKGRLEIFSATSEEVFKRASNSETDILISHEKVNTTWNYVKIDFPVFLVTAASVPKTPTFDNPGNIEKVLDYFGEGLIIPASSMKLGKEFNSFFKKHRLSKNILLESNIISCLVRFVASGTGCSFLPLPYIKSSVYQNHVHLIGPSEGYWKHTIYIYANLSKELLSEHPLVKTIRIYGTI